MKTTELSQSITVEDLLPQFIAENNSQLVQFIKSYYDWMENEGNTNNVIHTMGMTYEDQFVDGLYQLYLDEYASIYPFQQAVEKSFFLKHIRHVLSCKGSADSIKHFFRSIYNQEVDVRFPRERRKTYTGTDLYIIKTHILLNDSNLEGRVQEFKSLVGNFIVGEFSAAAAVESLNFYDVGAYKIVEILISGLLNANFVSGENIKSIFKIGENPDGSSINKTVEFIAGGIISDYQIVNGGSGYTEGQAILVHSESKIESCSAYVSEVDVNGSIKSIVISNPGYGFEVSSYGSFPLSSGSGAEIFFVASSSTNLVEIDPNRLAYIEYDKAVKGKGIDGEYVALGYFQEDYVFSGTGSRNPDDYKLSQIKANSSESNGKHYFEFYVESDVISNRFPSQISIGFCNDSINQTYRYTTAGIPQGSGYSNYQRIFCVAVAFNELGKADIYFGSVYSNGNGIKSCHWCHPSGVATDYPTVPVFGNVSVPAGGLFPSAEFKITPWQKIKILTTPAEFFGSVPNGFYAWDFGGSSTFSLQDDDNTRVSSDVLYRYKIRTSLSSPIWNKVYKLAIHPAGTKYEVEFVNYTNAIEDQSTGLSMKIKTTFYPCIENHSFAIYDIAYREHLTLDYPKFGEEMTLSGPVGDFGMSPSSNAKIYDLPTNIFDMDCMVNAAANVYVQLK